MIVKIINKSNNAIPEYCTEFSAGVDLRAYLDNDIEFKPLERVLIPTGIFIELPIGFEAQVRPRSGLAAKYGVTVLNSPGTIDSDYRGEIKVILVNLSNENFIVKSGERIAQMIISKFEKVEWESATSFSATERGDGGFGHTGIK